MKKTRVLVLLILIGLILSSCSFLSDDIRLYVQEGISAENQSDQEEMVTISVEEYEHLKQFQVLDEMGFIVDSLFYQEADQDAMITGMKRGFLSGVGDPYTFYYTAEEFEKMWEDDKGEYVGIGILISTSFETMESTVSRVFRNTPAEKVGLQKKDVLIRVEDLEVTPYTINDAVDLIRGEVGKEVEIEIRRGEENLVFTLTREDVVVNPEEYMMLTEDVGYIAFYNFTSGSHVAFTNAEEELMKKGAKGLIIDLRDNPGGWLTDALAIADEFIDGREIIAYMEDKNGSREYHYSTEGAKKIPLVVLINENSASASELLAGALKDYQLATLVGVNTFGKGIVQSVLPVGTQGEGMQLTVAQYFTPLENPVHEVGIAPDIEIPLPEGDIGMYELGDLADVQLAAGLKEIEALIAKN
ncbi:MAG: S41 family peptidase [Clostridiales bacterium]|nr:S41 family peptidase [Clostridiales bacterium]